MKIAIGVAAVLALFPAVASACPCCDHEDHHPHRHHQTGAAAAGVPRAPAAPLAAGEARAPIPIAGMHCGHCATSVKDALSRIDGVKSVDVYLDANGAAVVYEKDKVEPSKLTGAVNGLGFHAGTPTKN